MPVAINGSTFALLFSAATLYGQPYTTWKDYAGGSDSMQYSALKQITKGNVNLLELAWFHSSPGTPNAFNPIIVDGVMYVLEGDRSIAAIDAAAGKPIWSDPG
ncbi:MAG: hypothetical protein ACRD8O_21450 [Bryobacteraceae bacterium]